MASYQIKYKLDGATEVYTLNVSDAATAKTVFKQISPKIADDEIISISIIDSESSSVFSFVEGLFYGNLGLPMTYWVYGVLGGIVWAVGIGSLGVSQESEGFKLILLAFAAYYFVVYVGIWNAATKYTGSKIWSVLAKFMVIIVAIPLVINGFKWLFGDQ